MASDTGQRFKLTPVWLVTAVFCGLLIYIVIKKVDSISEVKVGDTGGIAFRNGAPTSLPPAEQHERSQEIQKRIEANIVEVAAPPPARGVAPAADLTGMWVTFDGSATWMVTRENGLFVFREQDMAVPGVITSAGYGPFDDRTWSLQFQSIVGLAGTGVLRLQDDGTLRGTIDVVGGRFPMMLRRGS